MQELKRPKTISPLAFWVVLVLTVAVGVGLRLLEIPDWNRYNLSHGVEFLLSKHDGYGWLAGAKAINQLSSNPFAGAIRLLHQTFNIPLDQIAFWLPAILAPLSALPVWLLTVWWKIPEAGIVSGFIAGSSIGYFIRTRISCLDTDILTLFFPLCLAVGLIIWIETFVPRFRNYGHIPSAGKTLLRVFLLGIVYRSYIAFYPSGNTVAMSLFGLALAVGVILVEAKNRRLLLCGLIILFLAGSTPWYGAVIAAGVVALVFWRPRLFERKNTAWALLIFSGGLFLWLTDITAKIAEMWFHFGRYARVSGSNDLSTLPSVIDTVPEAWPVSLDSAVFFMAGNWPIFIAAVIGLAIVMWKRPSALLLLPLLILGLASTRLGVRFTMYGGAILGIGLACGSAMLLQVVKAPRWASIVVQLALLLVVSWPILKTIEALEPEPVVTKPLVDALLELKQQASPDAQVWVRWDLAYEVQYYAERITLVDGYRNSAEDIFPVTFVHATNSPLSAYQMIAHTAQLQKNSTPLPIKGVRRPILPNPFPDLIQQRSPVDFNAYLQELKLPKLAWSHELPEQYLLLTWNGLHKTHTILKYGRWDFVRGKPSSGVFFEVPKTARLDQQDGVITRGSKTYPLLSLDKVNGQQIRHLAWEKNDGWYAIDRASDHSTMLMDKSAYQSMMVQMLLADPQLFSPYFELIIDHFPAVRIYRINPILISLPAGTKLFSGSDHEQKCGN